MPVFQVNSEFTIIINKEAVKLVPELRNLSEDELWYVILVADYVDGPYRKKPYEERVNMALRKIWGDKRNPPKSERIQIAIEGYKSLVFDIRRETVDIYKKKVAMLQKETLRDDVEIKRLREIDQNIRFLEDRISTIEHDLDIEEHEQIEIKGQKKLSQIEIWQRKQKEYKQFKDDA